MQQRVTPKSLIAENERRDYVRVRNQLKVIHWAIPISVTNSLRVRTRITP